MEGTGRRGEVIIDNVKWDNYYFRYIKIVQSQKIVQAISECVCMCVCVCVCVCGARLLLNHNQTVSRYQWGAKDGKRKRLKMYNIGVGIILKIHYFQTTCIMQATAHKS